MRLFPRKVLVTLNTERNFLYVQSFYLVSKHFYLVILQSNIILNIILLAFYTALACFSSTFFNYWVNTTKTK